MRRRLDPREIELRHLPHGLEDGAELLAEPLDLLLGEGQPRQIGDVQDFVPRDRHARILAETTRAPLGAHGHDGSPTS
jgi:hypothetical protein